MTKRFSAEGDLRTFIEVDYSRAMNILKRWSSDPNPHVRRLVSEGTRPRLPLTGRIRRFQQDPRPVITLLDRLKSDPSEYVRRSVANNINDISKDHPELAIDTLERWSRSKSDTAHKLVRHAARTLVKSGHPRAFALLGCAEDVAVHLRGLSVTPDRVRAGERIRFSFMIDSKAPDDQRLIIDYALHFVKANGSPLPKVFKLRSFTLPAGAQMEVSRSVLLKPTSGRRLYSGEHRIEILVNGRSIGSGKFLLL
jgi:3-methyladenine DNA glycosylase AlkC